MGGGLTDEQDGLRTAVRSLLDKESPELAVRATMDSMLGYEPELWSALGAMGLIGLAIPERFGGAGAGWSEQALVFTELGRALVCAPYLGTVGLAAPTLLAAGDEAAAARWLPEIAAGRLVATAALTGPLRRTAADVPVRAEWIGGSVAGDATDSAGADATEGAGGRWLLHGVEPYVLDGAVAELLLVLASTESGEVSLFALADWAAAVTASAPRTCDRTRRLARVELDHAEAVLVGPPGQGLRIAASARPVALAALAAEQVGGAARVLELTVDHARTREQFGRPIGQFQAVKHRCADMLVAVEGARSALWAAVRALEAPGDGALDDREVGPDLVTAIAAAVCAEAYARCASDCVQVHGGIGYTWEHPAHLHVKRSLGGSVLFGTPRQHRRLVAALVPGLAG